MNDHGTRRNGTHRRSLRIETLVTLDRVGILRSAVQAMRQQSQKVRARYVCHGAVVERAFGDRDPDAQLVIVEAWLAERFVLMPRSGMAAVAGFEDRVIAGKFGIGTQKLPGRGKGGFSIRQFPQLGGVHRWLQHTGRGHVPGAVLGGQIQISAFAAPLAAENHTHQDIAAPLQLSRRYPRFLDDEKSQPAKFIYLFCCKRLFQDLCPSDLRSMIGGKTYRNAARRVRYHSPASSCCKLVAFVRVNINRYSRGGVRAT